MAGSGSKGERGAVLVEFALVLPIFLTLVLATFTGALAYSVKLSITQAARDAARAGATLPMTTEVNDWLDQVALLAVRSADGELDASETGRRVCVAWIDGTSAHRRVATGDAAPVYESMPCFEDEVGDTVARRVQVAAERTSELEALVFSRTLDLEGRSVARYEVP